MTFSPKQVLQNRAFWTGVAIFAVSLLWYWFWRPYGLWYGGDSEYLDRQVNGGLWVRRREPLAVAAMQLCRQLVTLPLGWPVSWAISLASCLAGAVSTVVLWRLSIDRPRPWVFFGLVMASGFVLLYHGSIESYALPACALSLWILALDRSFKGQWPTGTIAWAFAFMVWCHLMSLFLLPALALSAWFFRDRLRKEEWKSWMCAFMAGSGVYFLTEVLKVGEGLGFGGSTDLFVGLGSGNQDFGPFFSLTHFRIKATFLWIGTGLSLPFALIRLKKALSEPFVASVGAMALCSLGFLILFHPDTGYRDWDLFTFPSLPVAVLAADQVAGSPRWKLFGAVWVTAFLLVWAPRVPIWAHLDQRGLGQVHITNFPTDRTIKLDKRYPIPSPAFKAQGGRHTLLVEKRGYLSATREFEIEPGQSLELEVPMRNELSPLHDLILEFDRETAEEQLRLEGKNE